MYSGGEIHPVGIIERRIQIPQQFEYTASLKVIIALEYLCKVILLDFSNQLFVNQLSFSVG